MTSKSLPDTTIEPVDSIRELLAACDAWKHERGPEHFGKVIEAAENLLPRQRDWTLLFGVGSDMRALWRQRVVQPLPLVQEGLVKELRQIAETRLAAAGEGATRLGLRREKLVRAVSDLWSRWQMRRASPHI